MSDIFISYRREDARADAGRLCDRLGKRFGEQHVFMDIDDIQPGADFTQVLDDTLDQCDVMLVMIGRQWLDADNAGRLHGLGDFVRLEIEKALSRRILIIPVLVAGATMPSADALPRGLRGLAQRQAFEIHDSSFHEDADRLIGVVAAALKRPPRWRRPAHLAWIAAVLVLLALGVMLQGQIGDWLAPPLSLRSEPATVSRDAVRRMLADHGLHDRARNPQGRGLAARYERRVINEQPVIVDAATRLMWQGVGSERAFTRAVADDAIAALNRRTFAGYADWRLPTLEEAMSLVRPEAQNGLYMDPLFGPRTAPFLWTADLETAGRGWLVYFFYGSCDTDSLAFNAYVRAVRADTGPSRP
ncbi:MAG: DUF1566 domain-containing protein [Betaproteobacteria bacterium]|nr:DUF1566 domain-containing protein [Betaproteobacteria bacterium]MDH3437361.1 DUF1566 domain-containing protein [Betaproteobacteria bacterium]